MKKLSGLLALLIVTLLFSHTVAAEPIIGSEGIALDVELLENKIATQEEVVDNTVGETLTAFAVELGMQSTPVESTTVYTNDDYCGFNFIQTAPLSGKGVAVIGEMT